MKFFTPLSISFLLCFAASSSAETSTNYTVLQNKCQGADSPGCCISSVRAMRDGKFQLAADGKCPTGQKLKTSGCEGSQSWCEPDTNADIAVNGGATGDYKGPVVKWH